MTQYRILYRRNDMPKEYVGCAYKYAHDEKSALLLLGSKADKNKFFRLKRGGTAQLISIEEVP